MRLKLIFCVSYLRASKVTMKVKVRLAVELLIMIRLTSSFGSLASGWPRTLTTSRAKNETKPLTVHMSRFHIQPVIYQIYTLQYSL